MLHPTWKSLREAELVLQTSWITFHQHLFSWCPTCSAMDIQSQCRPLWEPTIKDMIHHEASFLPKRSRFTLTLSLPWVSDNIAGIMWNLIWLPMSLKQRPSCTFVSRWVAFGHGHHELPRKPAPQLREKKGCGHFLQGNPTLLNDSTFAFRWFSITIKHCLQTPACRSRPNTVTLPLPERTPCRWPACKVGYGSYGP